MKILFPIGTLYPSQQGGPSNTIYWMAKALTSEGVEVTAITTDIGAKGKIPTNKWLDTEYGRVIYQATRFSLLPWRMMISTIHAMPQCDLAHLTSLFYPPSLVAAVAAHWYGKPIVWSPRGELDRLALVYSTWKKKPALWLIRRFLSKKVVFHSTSPEETERVKSVIGRHVHVVEIPNFLELPTLYAATPSVPPYILCIGRIHPKKAIENLIAALPNSPLFISSGTKLIIAGDSENTYGEYLKKQVKTLDLSGKVEFVGLVEGKKKQELYANAYCSVLPSHTENFGNVVVESLAQGTPVIASKGTPWARLEQMQAGFWVNNSSVALAKAIENTLSLKHEDYQSYRRNALKLACNDYDIHKNIRKWVEVYQAIIRS